MNVAQEESARRERNIRLVAELRARFKALGTEGLALREEIDGEKFAFNWEGTFIQACKDAFWAMKRKNVENDNLPADWVEAAENVVDRLRKRVEHLRLVRHCEEHGHSIRVDKTPRGKITNTCTHCKQSWCGGWSRST